MMDKLSEATKSEIIELAWCDDTSFDSIERQTGFPEKDVIQIMRSSLKSSSFRLWRKRVSGRKAKHDKLSRHQHTEKGDA